MSATPTEPDHPVTTRQTDLSAEMKRLMGKDWNQPEVEYEFSNGRQFKRTTDEYYRLFG